uniref:Uncharacterized protein n=1 Tax=Arundo donax TaxID=35708 RepID=A0A0A9EZ87_ARUDO
MPMTSRSTSLVAYRADRD